MPDIALRLEAVSHVFHRGTPSEVRALDCVDLGLERGSFTVVLGTNGSGKSSLLNVIAGSLALTEGRVYLDGLEVTGWPEQRRALRISRVFQNPFTGTASELSVAENLALASRRGGRRRLRRALNRDQRRVLREAVARLGMGLEDRLDAGQAGLCQRRDYKRNNKPYTYRKQVISVLIYIDLDIDIHRYISACQLTVIFCT
jgi:putative ABC transport system ATP-binding protein